MMNHLFRQQAVEHQQEKLLGNVVLTQPRMFLYFTLLLLFLFSATVLFITFGQYSRKESVSGYLTPDKGVIKVYATHQGVYRNINVNDGDYVKKGETLAIINTERNDSTGKTVNKLLSAKLREKKNNLLKQLSIQKEKSKHEEIRLNKSISNIKLESASLGRQISTQKSVVGINQDNLKKIRGLTNKKLSSQADHDKQLAITLDSDKTLQELELQQIKYQHQIDQLSLQLTQLPINTEETLSRLESELNEIEQQSINVQGQEAYLIKAPISGRVTYLQAFSGGSVSLDQPLLALVPGKTHFKAELFVPTRGIGFVEEDMPVRVRYSAFPYQRFGVYSGTVASMAETIFTPKELPIPLAINEPVYRVTVNLDQQSVNALGKRLPLQAGMQLEADIMLDQRSIISWVFQPIYNLKGKLL
jgi:membrane fusion protein